MTLAQHWRFHSCEGQHTRTERASDRMRAGDEPTPDLAASGAPGLPHLFIPTRRSLAGEDCHYFSKSLQPINESGEQRPCAATAEGWLQCPLCRHVLAGAARYEDVSEPSPNAAVPFCTRA